MRRARLWLQHRRRLVELLVAVAGEAGVLRLERDQARRKAAEHLAGRIEAEASLGILKAVLAEVEGDVDRLARERDSWRRLARHQPDDDEAARHAEVELRGGR